MSAEAALPALPVMHSLHLTAPARCSCEARWRASSPQPSVRPPSPPSAGPSDRRSTQSSQPLDEHTAGSRGSAPPSVQGGHRTRARPRPFCGFHALQPRKRGRQDAFSRRVSLNELSLLTPYSSLGRRSWNNAVNQEFKFQGLYSHAS